MLMHNDLKKLLKNKLLVKIRNNQEREGFFPLLKSQKGDWYCTPYKHLLFNRYNDAPELKDIDYLGQQYFQLFCEYLYKLHHKLVFVSEDVYREEYKNLDKNPTLEYRLPTIPGVLVITENTKLLTENMLPHTIKREFNKADLPDLFLQNIATVASVNYAKEIMCYLGDRIDQLPYGRLPYHYFIFCSFEILLEHLREFGILLRRNVIFVVDKLNTTNTDLEDLDDFDLFRANNFPFFSLAYVPKELYNLHKDAGGPSLILQSVRTKRNLPAQISVL